MVKIKPPHLLGNQIVDLCPHHSAKSRNMLGYVVSRAFFPGGSFLRKSQRQLTVSVPRGTFLSSALWYGLLFILSAAWLPRG